MRIWKKGIMHIGCKNLFEKAAFDILDINALQMTFINLLYYGNVLILHERYSVQFELLCEWKNTFVGEMTW